MAAPSPADSQTPTGSRPPVAPHVSDTLAVELEAPTEVRSGAELQFAIRVRNTAGRPLELRLLGRDVAFDLVVRDENDAIVWERLEGETVMAILRLVTVEPGAELLFEGAWDLSTRDGAMVPPGRYRIQGLVPTDLPEPLATPLAELRIAPPP